MVFSGRSQASAPHRPQPALLQSVGKGTRRAAIEEAVRSGCFEFEPLAEESNGLRESAVAEPEGALDDARLTADVAPDVEGPAWPLRSARITSKPLIVA